MDSLKLPPEPTLDINYTLWRKDITVWTKLTDTVKVKRGRALQYACRNNKRLHEAVLDIEDNLVDCNQGLENVLEVIDKLLGKSKHWTTVEAFEHFMSLQLEPTQNLEEFLSQFDLAISALKKTGNILTETLLFHQCLKALKLPDLDEKIIRSTVSDFTYVELKFTLKKIFGSAPISYSIQHNAELQNSYSQQNVKEGDSIQSEVIGKEKEEPTLNRKRKSSLVDPSRYFPNLEPFDKTKGPKIQKISLSKQNPCHKCFSPGHWKSICHYDADSQKRSGHFNVSNANAEPDQSIHSTFIELNASEKYQQCLEDVNIKDKMDYISKTSKL